MKTILALPLLFALAACHETRPEGSPPETEVEVVDEGGTAILGSVNFWSHDQKDQCVVYGESCSVALPAGDYSFTFRKERAGRTGAFIGQSVQGNRGAGCLRAKVHLQPGTKIVCKKRAEFNCARGAYETMDCGAASAIRYGYKPRPEDEVPPEK